MLLTHADVVHMAFQFKPPAQLGFGRERGVVLLETKMSPDSNTVIASAGT